MAILDTLWILFKSDASDVKKGADEAEKSVKKLSDDLKQLDNTSTKVGHSFLSMAESFSTLIAGSVVAATFIGGIKHAIEYGQELSKTSRLLNINAQDLLAWGNAVELAGGNADEFQHTLQHLSEHFNITAQTALNVLPKIADSFSKLNTVNALRYGKSLGLDQGTILFLQQGRREVEDVIRKQKELAALTNLNSESYNKLSFAVIKTKQSINTLYQSLASDIVPILTTVYKSVSEVFTYLIKHKDLVYGVLIALGGAASFMAAAFIRANPAIALAATALSAFALIYEDFVKFIRGEGNTVIGSLVNQFKKLDSYVKGKSAGLQDFISSHFGEQFTIRYGLAKQGVGGNSSSSSRYITTGPITINTQATNAEGIADDLLNHLFQANSYVDDGVQM